MKDVKFLQVEFTNFMSYGNKTTIVDLSQPGTTYIVGENLDEGGSSGAGKTTVIAAISYALFDKIPSGVSKDKLINRTNDKRSTTMEVVLTFMQGDNKIVVRRSRGARTGVQLFENDKDITPDSIVNFNAKVEDLVGMSFLLFNLIVSFSGSARLFLDLGIGEQRNLIEELLRITTLSKKANALKRETGLTERAIDLQKTLISQQELQNKTYKKHVAEAQERVKRWTITRDGQLLEIQAKLDRLEGVDFDAEAKLHEEISSLNKQVTPLQAEVLRVNQLRKTLEKESSKLTEELKHLNDDKCPYCLQKFEDSGKKISEIQDKLTSSAHELTSLEASINEKQEVLLELNNSIFELNGKIKNSDLNELLKIKQSAEQLQAKMIELANQDNPHVEALNSLLAEGEVKIDYAVLDDLVKLLAHQQFLVKLLTDKNSFIRKDIISKNIPYLNKRIAFYTEAFNLPHIVLFRPDMSCEISQYGRTLDHGNLSNGEKRRLNFALCLAFRDVRAYLNTSINVLFVDEVDAGSICPENIQAMIRLMKRKAYDDSITIYCISHSPEFTDKLDKTVIVRKEAGFSEMIEQPS